jgi:hypothetical protein
MIRCFSYSTRRSIRKLQKEFKDKMDDNLYFWFGELFNRNQIRRLKDEMNDCESLLTKDYKMSLMLKNNMKHDLHNILKCFKSIHKIDLHETHFADMKRKVSTNVYKIKVYLANYSKRLDFKFPECIYTFHKLLNLEVHGKSVRLEPINLKYLPKLQSATYRIKLEVTRLYELKIPRYSLVNNIHNNFDHLMVVCQSEKFVLCDTEVYSNLLIH